MTDREKIKYFNYQIGLCNMYRTRPENKRRINYINKVQANNISNLIIVLIRLISDKHCQ